MSKAVIYFIVAKCVAGNVKPPYEIGLMLAHWPFAVFTYFGNIRHSCR